MCVIRFSDNTVFSCVNPHVDIGELESGIYENGKLSCVLGIFGEKLKTAWLYNSSTSSQYINLNQFILESKCRLVPNLTNKQTILEIVGSQFRAQCV